MTEPSDIRFRQEIPEGDNRLREVCQKCGFIHYVNPKIVVGSVVTWDGRFLLCRRAIEPREGFWTLPAGFLEARETTEEGARREAREEANAEIEITALLGIYSIPHISQVQLFYKANLKNGEFSPGPESLETRLYAWDEIPRGDLAFPSVPWALDHYRKVEDTDDFPPFSAVG